MTKTIKLIAVFVLLVMSASCHKDDKKEPEKNNPLVGQWLYRESNLILYYADGSTFNAKEEGMNMSDLNQSFHGLYFAFEKDGRISGGQNGQSSPLGTYTVSGNKLSIAGEMTMKIEYKILGNMLEWIWNRDSFEAFAGPGLSNMFDSYGIDYEDYEVIMTFEKTN